MPGDDNAINTNMGQSDDPAADGYRHPLDVKDAVGT
jgi:hypothetical protein